MYLTECMCFYYITLEWFNRLCSNVEQYGFYLGKYLMDTNNQVDLINSQIQNYGCYKCLTTVVEFDETVIVRATHMKRMLSSTWRVVRIT